MEAPTNVILKPGEAERVLAGHPWLHARSILKLTRPAADGDVVQIKDHKNRFLGIGFYNSVSKIQVRVMARERCEIDREFFAGRIRAAHALRRRDLPEATSYRVVNAEADFLSGLIVDRYGDVLVIQTTSLGMDQRKAAILGALRDEFQPRAIIERNDTASRKFEGLPDANGILEGTLEGPMPVELNGLKFETDPLGGHKTGLYLDQQTNYRLAAELIARHGKKRVLDCFSFIGGFTLHAARAGAQVHAIDQSEAAIQAAERNAKANGLEARCSFETGNVFDWLKAHTSKGEGEKTIPQFDTVILDPPSFTRSRSAIGDAMRGYKEIHVRAFKLLQRGGLLFTYCCSHHVSAEMFQSVVLDAAFDTRRTLRRIAVCTQGPDHPVIPAIPETEYLKGFVFEVV